MWFDISQARAKWAFDATRRARFYQKMAQFMRDGKDAYSAVKLLNKRYQAEKSPLGLMTETWLKQTVQDGFSMRVAKGWLADAELGLILAGESRNNAQEGFRQAERLARATALMQSKTFNVLATPLFALSIAVMMILGFRFLIGPVLLDILPLNKWPMSARMLYHFSGFMATFGIFVAMGAAMVGSLVAKSMPMYTGGYRPMLDYVPPWSIYKVMASSSFLIAIAGMMKQGTPLDTSIKEYRQYASPYVDRFLDLIQKKKLSGKPEAEAMDVGFLDKEIAGDIKDMGESSGLVEVMQSIGEDALEGAVKGIDRKAAILKFILTIIVAMNLVWIFSSFVMTSYTASEVAKKEMQQTY